MDMTGYAAKLGLIKSNHGYDKLCCETQVNPTYLFLNIKKKYNLEFFFKIKSYFLLVVWVASKLAKSTK
jgi:hypothetical protein